LSIIYYFTNACHEYLTRHFNRDILMRHFHHFFHRTISFFKTFSDARNDVFWRMHAHVYHWTIVRSWFVRVLHMNSYNWFRSHLAAPRAS